jgi:hypothetical protein
MTGTEETFQKLVEGFVARSRVSTPTQDVVLEKEFKPFSFRMPEDVFDDLETVALCLGVSKSEVIRLLIAGPLSKARHDIDSAFGSSDIEESHWTAKV